MDWGCRMAAVATPGAGVKWRTPRDPGPGARVIMGIRTPAAPVAVGRTTICCCGGGGGCVGCCDCGCCWTLGWPNLLVASA